ncbi:hypothetical protein ACQY0O_001477 [Thecaphora frezii]
MLAPSPPAASPWRNSDSTFSSHPSYRVKPHPTLSSTKNTPTLGNTKETTTKVGSTKYTIPTVGSSKETTPTLCSTKYTTPTLGSSNKARENSTPGSLSRRLPIPARGRKGHALARFTPNQPTNAEGSAHPSASLQMAERDKGRKNRARFKANPLMPQDPSYALADAEVGLWHPQPSGPSAHQSFDVDAGGAGSSDLAASYFHTQYAGLGAHPPGAGPSQGVPHQAASLSQAAAASSSIVDEMKALVANNEFKAFSTQGMESDAIPYQEKSSYLYMGSQGQLHTIEQLLKRRFNGDERIRMVMPPPGDFRYQNVWRKYTEIQDTKPTAFTEDEWALYITHQRMSMWFNLGDFKIVLMNRKAAPHASFSVLAIPRVMGKYQAVAMGFADIPETFIDKATGKIKKSRAPN